MAKNRVNRPCTCGSGKRFRKCCGNPHRLHRSRQRAAERAEIGKRLLRAAEAKRVQREKQQGLGKAIISAEVNNRRVVAVGNRIHHSDSWKTFHDFLRDYLIRLLGPDWFKAETAKPEAQRHPIVRWHEQAHADLARLGTKTGDIVSGPMTGAQRAFLNLAYNLYLIAHHADSAASDELLATFVDRLKSERADDFVGKLFETYAAAAFLKAGFTIVYEDESDGGSSHVEFVATHRETGKKFSVEVKTRNRAVSEDGPTDEIKRLRVASKLNKALTKNASHTRVVVIEINVPDVLTKESLGGWPQAALDQIRAAERVDAPDGSPKPSAYVLVTNHAFHNNLAAVESGAQVLAVGCRIPDFGPDIGFDRFKAVLESRARHREMFDLMDSLRTHYEIPSTFDGEIPDLAFDPANGVPPLKFGRWYSVPMGDGREVPGQLVEATVMEGKAYGIYRTTEGTQIMATSPLTEAELAGWERHPDTFFGEIRPTGGRAENWLDLCEFLYQTYRETPRDRLLEFMGGAPDFAYLQGLSQEDLAIEYCERVAHTNFRSPSASVNSAPAGPPAN
jgi:hypothetical protein